MKALDGTFHTTYIGLEKLLKNEKYKFIKTRYILKEKPIIKSPKLFDTKQYSIIKHSFGYYSGTTINDLFHLVINTLI